MDVKQVVNLLEMPDNDLSDIEEQFKTLRNDISTMQFRKHTLERNLYQLNNQIASTTNLMNSLRISCIREIRKIAGLQ
jgi:flagellar capping protein FliD